MGTSVNTNAPKSSRRLASSISSGVLDLSRMTKSSVVFFGLNTLRLTWKIVFRSGFPLATSLPMSLHHMFTRSTSAAAIANSAVCFSNAVSSSPRSRLSVPSRSMTSVGTAASSPPLAARDSHTPFVVCDLPKSAFISSNRTPKTWFSSVLLPLLCGPMMATTWYASFHRR